MFVLTVTLALAFVLLLARLEGDESVGFGGEFLINDGAGDTYVIVPKVETLGIPNETTGIVESKRLDLTDGVIKKLATLKNGGSFTVKIQHTAATWARLEAIRKPRTEKKFRVRIPCDTGFVEKTVPGIITANPIEDLESEKITVINCNIEVSGAEVVP